MAHLVFVRWFHAPELTREFRIRIRIVGPPRFAPLMIFGESSSVQKSQGCAL